MRIKGGKIMSKFSIAIKTDAYKNLINDTLGDKETAKQFIADISTCVANNPSLQLCDVKTVLSAGLVAQTLKLPLTQSLGFAYIIPYKDKAQFQIGWKGLVQLAQRSGQFERVGVSPVHEGEWVGLDEFGEDEFEFSHKFDSAKIIGYYAYFKLNNGFKKTLYWTVEQCLAHGKKYSKSFNSKGETNVWRDLEEQMCEKTVLKQLLSKYAPLSVDLQKAVVFDQAVVDAEGKPEYIDNEKEETKEVGNTLVAEEE